MRLPHFFEVNCMTMRLYAQPVIWMLAEIVVFPIIWAWVLSAFSASRKIVFLLSCLLLAMSVLLIGRVTILNREIGAHSSIVSLPFQLVRMAVFEKPELFRSLLLNILLFAPFGAALASLLSDKLAVSKRVFLCCGAGMLVSVLVEICQYRFLLGNAEADDVICNTLGTWIGTLSLPLSLRLIEKNKRSKTSAPGSQEETRSE